MLSARDNLARRFGFKELTIIEIKSLVEIARKIVPVVNERDSKKFTDFNEIVFGDEAIALWLNENYGVDVMAEVANEPPSDKGSDKEQKEQRGQFVDYVRKVRDAALLAEKK